MEFVALVDLVKTVTKNKVKNIEVLGNPGEEANLTELLYDAISKGKVSTDEEAVKFLYGKKESPRSATYLRTKNRLIRQLVNVSLFVDINQPMFNDRAKAYFNCYRDFASAQILNMRNARSAAIAIFEQILEQTIKYEIIELTADISRELRKLYSRNSADQMKHEKISEIHRQYEEKRQLEILAFEYHETLINYYLTKRSPNDEIHKLASLYYDELMPLATKADTSQFYLNTYMIGLIKYFSINDCVNALSVCEECFAVLKQRKNTKRSALAAVLLQKIACLIQLRKFGSDCDETVMLCASLEEEGAFNWFRAHELHVHYCMFAGRYSDAFKIYSTISSHEKFSTLSGAVRDNWQLYGGYLHLLAAFGKLDAEKVTSTIGAFRYARLNNEIGVVDRDKQGMNIPLVLLPILYTLAKGDFDNSDISPDALEKYRKRYLDNDLNRRSAAFLNLLLAFSKREYKGASAEKKIKKELNILATEQPLIAGQTYAVEIIPYEDLWDMLAAL